MATVVWTARARKDLADIGDYHAAQSPEYAEVLVRRLLGAVGRLDVFPRSGRALPDAPDEALREIVYRNYRIVYFYADDEDRVDVLSVFHSSRQFGSEPS